MVKSSGRVRHFIAILPPIAIQQEATALKQHFAERYNSRAALRSPPHITLVPPFEWRMVDRDRLIHALVAFARDRAPFTVEISGFGAFPPRVIYLNVLPTPALMTIQRDLVADVEKHLAIRDRHPGRPFRPHLTLAFRDLTPAAFRSAWPCFATQAQHATFTADALTLLTHSPLGWQVDQTMRLQSFLT
ncbi:MAG: 2'-5' RNA ligase family protein [Leptolyngbyaceae cyanobacterium T60_A2020_046]|nr:2'-5' RNA ligase family protein [Leptolyngbyaceae cyanobacterium T60_A2020_046]